MWDNIIGYGFLALVVITAIYFAKTRFDDWVYDNTDGPYPKHFADEGETYRDINGKLWLQNWGGWVPGHLWARIRERHNMARDAVIRSLR